MKKGISSSLLFILLVTTSGYSWSYEELFPLSTEQTPDSTIFQQCLDSIEKYVYVDSRKIKPYKALCEEMLVEGKELTNRHELEFVIQSIYDEYVNDNPMGVLEILESNRNLLDYEDVLPNQITHFNYLAGYTSLILGEVEDAQATFYELLENARANKDTSTILQSVNSLGKLLVLQEDFKNAEKYFLEYNNLLPIDKPVHRVNGYVELVDLYLSSNQFDKAEYYNSIALELVDSLSMVDLKLDALLQKVSIEVENDKITEAKRSLRKAYSIAEQMDNLFYEQLCQFTDAKILKAQGQFDRALLIYEELINTEENGEGLRTKLFNYYQLAYDVAQKNGDYEKAYNYILKTNELKESLLVDEQKQKSQYLRIKFDAEQKEKENAVLVAQVSQKKSENNLLFALMIFCLVSIAFLVLAFNQKRKYNDSLKNEVRNRTRELENANVKLLDLNEELHEFNNILSHDLKEPLRGIVGFSQMATKELEVNNAENKRLINYLSYVNNSGRQLHNLIEDVASFRSIENPSPEKLQLIDLNLLISSIIESNNFLTEDKNVSIKFQNLPSIYSYNTMLYLVFKNLIENGIKFNKSLNPTITISYEKRSNNHHFLVRDNGIGIEPKFHEDIFTMFNRLHDRKSYEGSGLGLNIVKKILAKLGGGISIVESKANIGSLFEVTLPLVKSYDV